MKENLDNIGSIFKDNNSDDENDINTNTKINKEINNKESKQKNKLNKKERLSIKSSNFQEIDDFLIVLDNSQEYKKMILDQARKKIWKVIKKIKESKDINEIIYDPTLTKKYIINPEKNRILPLFNFLIYILLYLDIVITPFEYLVYYNQRMKLIRIVSFDLIFIIEIIITIFTSYYDIQNKYYVTDIKKIFKNYLYNGFIPNILYVFPFYLISDKLEIIRFLKIYRYPYISNQSKAILSWILSFMIKNNLLLSQISRVIIFFLNLCYILHACACIYCYLGLHYSNSWIWQYYELVDSTSTIDIYVSSYYFITETFSSTGYGDLTPINSAEILFIMFCEILNCGLYAYLLSNILDIFINKENSDSYKYRASQNQFEQWIAYYMSRLPSSSKRSNLHRNKIWNQAKRFHELYYDNTKNFLWLNDKNFFVQMKPSHRNELLKISFENIFTKFQNFFNEIKKLSSKINIITNFKTSIQVRNTEIIIEGKQISKIYFIDKGQIDLFYKNKKINTLKEGDIFGIEGILKNYNKSKLLYKVNPNCGYVILFIIDIGILIKNILNYDGDSFFNLYKIAQTYINKNIKNENDNEINIDKEENKNGEIITSSINDNNNEEVINKYYKNYNLLNSGRLFKLNSTIEQLEKANSFMDESNIRIDLIDKQINFINNYFTKIINKENGNN